ncbi:MAG: ferrous iron transport protein A [Deltaproteobacteria bacterium]|nr:ferrous iron transport protein A [Deltaproteobacteria bacterium]
MTIQTAATQHSSTETALSNIRPGKRVRLVEINAGRNLQGRLLALGLIRGTQISVITNEGSGPLLIGLGESRMSLGHGMAEKILVE